MIYLPLFFITLLLFYASDSLEFECNNNYIAYDLNGVDVSKVRNSEMHLIRPGHQMVLNYSGLLKFIARGLQYGRDFAARIVIPKIAGDINLVVLSIHYSIEELQLDDFYVNSFTVNLPRTENDGTNPNISISDAGVFISSYISWKSTSWPPMGETYNASLKVRNMSIYTDMLFYNKRNPEKVCPYHVKLTTDNSYINLGNVSIKLTNLDGTDSAIGAMINLIVPAFIDVIQKAMGPVLIDAIFDFLGNFFNTKSIVIGTGYNDKVIQPIQPIRENWSPYILEDFRISEVRNVPSGIRIDFGGYYLNSDKDMSRASNDGVDTNDDVYYNSEIDAELYPESPFPNLISSADIAFSWTYHAVNSLLYQLARNTSFFRPNMFFSVRNVPVDVNQNFVNSIFGHGNDSLALRYFRSLGDSVDQKLVTRFQNGEEVSYSVNLQDNAIPYIKMHGASGLLMEADTTVKIKIGSSILMESNVTMDFVLKPEAEFIQIDMNDGTVTNGTAINFDFIPYSVSNSMYTVQFKEESKLLDLDYEELENLGSSAYLENEQKNTNQKQQQKPSLIEEIKSGFLLIPHATSSSLSSTIPKELNQYEAYFFAILQELVPGPYFTTYSRKANASLFLPNVPLYSPEDDKSYFTYSRNYFTWNINLKDA